MQRKVVITEEHGLYTLQTTGGISVTGKSAEDVYTKALVEADRSLHEIWKSGDVTELLLGPKREGGGQIHTGVVSG